MLVETLMACKKNEKWFEVGKILSRSHRSKIVLNLGEIDKIAETGEKIVVPGKILSQGDIIKKIKIIALAFSDSAGEKLNKSKIDFNTILEEINKNPDAKGIRILD